MQFLVILFLVPALLQAEYTKLEYTDCGSKEFTVYDANLTPMPIFQPGNATLNLEAGFDRDVQGPLKTEFKIVRRVFGIYLPIRCYLVAGVFYGSCTYDDLCTVVQKLLPDSYNPQACPAELAKYGIDCTCPFKFKKGPLSIKNQVLELPDASKTVATLFANGDFDIFIKASDDVGPYACLNIKFSVRRKKQIPK